MQCLRLERSIVVSIDSVSIDSVSIDSIFSGFHDEMIVEIYF